MKFSLAGTHGKSYTISIVEATSRDREVLRTILDIDLMTFSQPTWSQVTVELMLEHGRVYLLKADEMAIGTCCCMRSWAQPSECALFGMAIRPGWRGKGLGSRFLQGVIDFLDRDGVRSVVLEVDATNRQALRVYESRFGFRQVNHVDDHVHPGVRRLVMRRVIREDTPPELAELPAAALG